MDILRIAARVASVGRAAGTGGMDPIYCTVTRPAGMTLEEAVELVRPAVPGGAGAYEEDGGGDFELPDGRVGAGLNLEMDPSAMVGRKELYVQDPSGRVTLEAEWP